MIKTATVLILAAFTCSSMAGDLFRLSTGLDMNHLSWEHGENVQWSFLSSLGVRLFDDVYVGARLSIPIPFFIIIGNQVSYGGEVSYIPLNPRNGFTLKATLAASRCFMWPENIIVILADGQTTEPPRQYDYDDANGLRLEALVSIGHKWDSIALWLDLGLDHRMMEVERTVQNQKIEGDFDFTGAHVGISVDLFL